MASTSGPEQPGSIALETPGSQLKRRADVLEDNRSDNSQRRSTRKTPRKATMNQNEGSSRTNKDNESPRKAKSIKDLARPYLLTVAKLQLKALKTTWSIGSNRKLDTEHVSKLKSAFEKE
ncbi:hypothetical protein E4U59_000116 [Claviceps monticola]|nr:hypothetical protein E4U59_000116 [Claviceps monticola]